MEYKLLASAPSETAILDCIKRYFYGGNFTVQNGIVHNSRGAIQGFRVIHKGKRYRFECLI